MITEDKITEIFCAVDEFCKEFDKEMDKKSLMSSEGTPRRYRRASLSESEIMTILIAFQFGSFRNFKHYYLFYIRQHLRSYFPNAVSYNRFVERQAKVALHLLLFLNTCALGRCTGISIIDSTPLVSCHIKRMHMHKTMRGLAAKGKCTMGWFYGFKLHLVINDKAEIIQWMLTPGNVDDRDPLKNKEFTDKLFGKLFADRGYISQSLFETLFVDDIHLVTKIKKNMKNSLMNLYDKIVLRKRVIVETVNEELKNTCNIEHTRHRSIDNFCVNLFAAIIAYNLLPKKPEMNIEIIDKSRIIA